MRNYLEGKDNFWEGFSYAKVFRDEGGNRFEDGCGKYAAYAGRKLLGYVDTCKKAEELFLKYKAGLRGDL